MKEDRRYHGTRGPTGCVVVVNGCPLPVRLDLRQHSPDGFNWGYAGSGPSQLAVAMLADFFAHEYGRSLADANALKHYHQFTHDVIAHINGQCWELSSPYIEAWYVEQAQKDLQKERAS